jgi:drug/metabolite transporter (DMT)-like permease
VSAWVLITVAAAFLQNLRSTIQRKLEGPLGVSGSTLSRFLYAAPFATVSAVVLLLVTGQRPNHADALVFFPAALGGGIAQILATAALIHAVTRGNFAVGTALSKTETLQAALFSAVALGETLALWDFVGLLISFSGVVLLAFRRRARVVAGLDSRAAMISGLASGGLFALSAVSYRGASLSLGMEGAVVPAALTLAFVTCAQTVMMSAWLAWRQPATLRATLAAWRQALPAGLAGWAASAGWFTAMTLQHVALVRAVAQVELVFTLAVSKFTFREALSLREGVGIAAIIGGIVVLLVL